MEKTYQIINQSTDFKYKTIPKIAHFIFEPYYLSSMPNSWSHNLKKFIQLHPDYETHIWSLSDGTSFIKDNYPQLISTFNNLPEVICKLDFLRYVLLHYYGGYYIDLDISWYQPLPEQILNHHLILVKEDNFKIIGQLNNCFIGAIKNHPFFVKCIQNINHKLQKTQKQNLLEKVLDLTGPVMLTETFIHLNKKTTFLNWSLNTNQDTPYQDTFNKIFIFPKLFYSRNIDTNSPYTVFCHHMDSTWCDSEQYYYVY